MLSNSAEHSLAFGEAEDASSAEDSVIADGSVTAEGSLPVAVAVPDAASYLDAFGLYINPFSEVSDEKFYFESPALKQRLQTLVHMVENNKALLCLTGDEGGGKTTLLKQFISLAQETWQPFEVDVGTETNERQVLARVAQGIKAPVCRYQFSGILSRLKILNEKNHFPVLVIDDAHNMSPKVIAALQKLKKKIIAKDLKMSIVLFADRSIKSLFNHKLLRDLSNEWVYSIYLPRLSEKDTAQYIQHRMTVAGMLIDKPFKPADIAAVYKMSKGLPRKVNEVAHRMLLSNYGSEDTVSTLPASWLEKFKGIGVENGIYFLLGIFLLVLLVTVESGSERVVAKKSSSVEQVSGKEIKSSSSNRIHDKLCDAELFVGCDGKDGAGVDGKRNIVYK